VTGEFYTAESRREMLKKVWESACCQCLIQKSLNWLC
jgi:hypothetical protein